MTLLAVLWPSAAGADPAAFDLTLFGLRAGVLTVDGTIGPSDYRVSGRLRNAGLLGVLKRIRYEAQSEGAVTHGRLRPRRYRESTDTGQRQSEAVIAYDGDIADVVSYAPRHQAEKPDAAGPAGTLDPLTALFAVLRDVTAAEACRFDAALFDGRRLSRVRLSAPFTEGDTILCQGEYQRVAGFTAGEMEDRTRFSFVLIYRPAGAGTVHVTEIRMDTLYGRGALKRR